MIESAMVPIIVPYDDRARQLLAELEHAPFVGRTARALQPYTAQVPRRSAACCWRAAPHGPARGRLSGPVRGARRTATSTEPDLGLTWDDPTFRQRTRGRLRCL